MRLACNWSEFPLVCYSVANDFMHPSTFVSWTNCSLAARKLDTWFVIRL